jgi:hypothetical protein
MTTARKEKGWHIELGKKRRKTTFIRELIKKYRNALYGWTNCDEFRNEIIPNVTALVEERRNKHVVDGQVGGNVGDLSGMIKRAIMELPVDTLRELISQKVAVETAVTKNEQPQEESQAEQVGPTVPTYSKESLVVMTKAQLREIAGTYNIATSATSKNADLVNAILEAQGAAPSQGVDESYDDLPTEEEMVIR